MERVTLIADEQGLYSIFLLHMLKMTTFKVYLTLSCPRNNEWLINLFTATSPAPCKFLLCCEFKSGQLHYHSVFFCKIQAFQ